MKCNNKTLRKEFSRFVLCRTFVSWILIRYHIHLSIYMKEMHTRNYIVTQSSLSIMSIFLQMIGIKMHRFHLFCDWINYNLISIQRNTFICIWSNIAFVNKSLRFSPSTKNCDFMLITFLVSTRSFFRTNNNNFLLILQ